MSVEDPTRWFVFFKLGPDPQDAVAVEVDPRDDAAVERAWKETADHGIRVEQVTELVADWQPSAADIHYIEQTFGQIETLFALPRPEPDGWDAALAEASMLREDADRQFAEEQLSQMAVGILADTKDGVVLPLLRSSSLPNSDGIKDRTWTYPVCDGVYASLARVARTPRGTIGMTHLLNHDFTDHEDFVEQLVAALEAVTIGLRVEGQLTEYGEMLSLRREPDNFQASAAIVLPNFHQWIGTMRDWPELVVFIPSLDDVLIAPAGSPLADDFRRKIEQGLGHNHSGEFLPSLLRITADQVELLLEEGARA